jgi:hypothetical protein
MSQVQIIRGTAALPPDIESEFVRTHGREMTPEEREFFGLTTEPKAKNADSSQQDTPRAA